MSTKQLTTDQFSKALPKAMRKNVDQKMVDRINLLLDDPDKRDLYRENLLSYTSVLGDGKFKITSYVEAIKYVSNKLLGSSNLQSYVQTFPDKYQKLIDKGLSDKEISSYVSAYNKNKLVNLVLEQTLVPSHILNADLYQKALNVQAELMMDAKSEKVRSDAANSLLTHLKPPETKKIELDIGRKEDRAIDELRQATLALAAQQKSMLEAGVTSVKDVAHSQVVIDNDSGDLV